MKLNTLLISAIILIGFSTYCEAFLHRVSLQDYINQFVDVVKFKQEGILKLNDTAVKSIWNFFKSKYRRVYASNGEENNRFDVFFKHLQFVLKSNLDKFQTYYLELNEFADWTLEEFNVLKKGLDVESHLQRNVLDDSEDDESYRDSLKKLYQRHHYSRRIKRNIKRRLHFKERFFTDWFSGVFGGSSSKSNQTKTLFDWREKAAVSSVKNQLKCGSCYAFATATIMETLYAIKTNSKTTIDLSSQQLTDCSNNGCRGGNFEPSIRYISSQNGKMATEASYSYVGKKQECRTSGFDEINLGHVEYGSIPVGDEKALENALVNYGPVFIGVDAESLRFMFYRSGVLRVSNCPSLPKDMDHAMVVVGHGYDNALKMPYWIIKNSWGASWGEKGYLRLAKDAGNMCGVATMASYGKLT